MNKGLSFLEGLSSEEGHKTLCWSLIKGLVYIRALGCTPGAVLLLPYLKLTKLLDAMFLFPLRLQTTPKRLAGIILSCRKAMLPMPYNTLVAPYHLS
jgi:hypothetical protein